MLSMARTMMSSSRAGDKLSSRLHSIYQTYSGQKCIWDIGCDHGLLGMSFRGIDTVEEIHLVDPSMEVINVLKNKLKDSYITKPTFIHHQSGQEIKVESSSNHIFIAGMGGKEILSIIESLVPQLDSSSVITISPHRKILELRSALKEMPIALKEELLVKEDGQFYQILTLIPNSSGRRVSPFGEDFWNGEGGREYREHQLNHFSLHRDEASREYVTFLKSLK